MKQRQVISLFCVLLILTVTSSVYAQSTQWKQLPLRSVAQKAAGLMGGEGMQMVQDIAYAPSNPQIVYMVSDTSQVWKSIDGGVHWQMKHKGFNANGGLSVVVDPHNENIALVAGFLGHEKERVPPNASPLSGIFRTIDGGESWDLIKKVDYYDRLQGKHFAFDPSSCDGEKTKTIYAGTYQDGLFKSVDGGDSWADVALKGVKIFDVKISLAEPSEVYLATKQGLYLYDDNQGEVNKIGKGLPDFPRNVVINPVQTNIVYTTVGASGVYYSVDGGNSFVARNNGLWTLLGKEYLHLAISPVNPENLYVSAHKWSIANPFWSHDGGASWHKPDTLDKEKLSLTGGGRFFAGPIAVHPNNPEEALTSANGAARILKTTDGGQSWVYSSSGYTGGRKGIGRSSQAFYNDPKKMILFLIDFGLVLTEDGGETWRLLPVPKKKGKTTSVGIVDPTGNSRLIVTTVGKGRNHQLAVSDDGGQNWRFIPGTVDKYKFIGIHPQKPEIIYAQGWKSLDSGTTWQKLSKKVLAVYPANGDIVYTVESSKSTKRGSVVFRSTDGGNTWEKSFGVLSVNIKGINEIDVDPTDPSCVYVASGKGLYIYNNGLWVRKGEESGLMQDSFGMAFINNVVVDPRHPEVVYVGRRAPFKGHSNGIFRSRDFGQTWENITYNLGPEISCWSISVSPHDGRVYFGSSHGTWVLDPPY